MNKTVAGLIEELNNVIILKFQKSANIAMYLIDEYEGCGTGSRGVGCPKNLEQSLKFMLYNNKCIEKILTDILNKLVKEK